MDEMVVTGSADGSLAAWRLTSDRSFDSRDDPPPPLDWEVVNADTADRAASQRGPLFSVAAAHGATVTAIAPAGGGFLVTGGADNTVAVWSHAGAPIRQLKCHEAAVTALSASDTHFVSASADHSAVLWEVRRGADGDAPVQVEQIVRLEGHDHAVTAVANTGAEVVTGDAAGVVIVWDTARAKAVRKHAVHRTGRPVLSLQFDVSKIVSYGGDQQLVVTDLWTGAPLQQTLQPHGLARVVGLQYDTFSLLTVASDRTVRVWPWRQSRLPNGTPPPSHVAARPREHIVRGEEQLMDVARFYEVDLAHLLAWNNLRDATRTFPGQRLVLHGVAPAAAPSGGGFNAAISVATAAAMQAADAAGASGGGGTVPPSHAAASSAAASTVHMTDPAEEDSPRPPSPTRAVAALNRLRSRTMRRRHPLEGVEDAANPSILASPPEMHEPAAGGLSAPTAAAPLAAAMRDGGAGGADHAGEADGASRDEEDAALRLRAKFSLPGAGGRERLRAHRGRSLAALAANASRAGAWQVRDAAGPGGVSPRPFTAVVEGGGERGGDELTAE
jgi:hypothetical protein